ncbi:hypothetical protein [Pectinatus frisingensis]|uniref:hypothetical protein n=1 Tax=Pectinatus frisingensis TaxID=865 RepID=UPI0039BF113B
MDAILLELRKYTTRWLNCFFIADMLKKMQEINKWIRRRIKIYLWKKWKKIAIRPENFEKWELDKGKAWKYTNTRLAYRRVAGSSILNSTLTDKYLGSLAI